MKKLLLALAVATLSLAASAQQTMWVATGSVYWAFNTSQLVDDYKYMPYADATTVTVQGKTFNIADIDSIWVVSEEVDDNLINVDYADSEAQVVISGNIAQYLTATVTGARVAIIQDENVTEELTYTLSGSSTDGSFWMDGEKKIVLALNGLTLSNADSAAINIRDGKNITVQLVDGTTNTLADASTSAKKACFMVNGHTEFKGGGALVITGNKKHAFAGDEYVEVKKSVGSITIKGSVKDAFSISQYFQMNGGTVTIESTGDDGIQVDKTDDETDENNGQVIIKGGTLTINASEAATKAIKAEGSVTISGGTINITHSGVAEWDSDDLEVKSPACIKSDGNVTVAGDEAVMTLKATGNGARGITCDSVFTLTAGTIDITATGGDLAYSSGSNADTASVKCIKADLGVVVEGGSLTMATSKDEAVGMHSKGTTALSGGTVTCNTYDHGIKSAGDMVISDAAVVNFTITGAASKGIKADENLTITGGTISGTTSGGGEWDATAKETSACAGVKCNGNMVITGGTFDITSSGAGGKGISADGTLNISGGTFNITTTGARYTYGSSSSGGGWGGGGSSSSSYRSSPKGIKADGNITISDGTFTITTTGGEGSEGIESKGVMTVTGGTFEMNGYDDCLNSSSHMYIKGGQIYTNATNNDGLDANGNLYIDGGTLMVYGASSPECGLDANEEGGYSLYVRGGTVVAIGGGTSYPGSITNAQPCIVYSGSLTQGTTYLLKGTSNNILAFTMTKTYSGGGMREPGGGGGGGGGGRGGSTTVLMSSPSLSTGSSYTLYSGASVSGDNFHSLYTSPTVSTTGSSLGSVSSLSTPYSSIGSSSGW